MKSQATSGTIGWIGGPGADGWAESLGLLAASCDLALRPVAAGGWEGLAGVILLGSAGPDLPLPGLDECRIVPTAGAVGPALVRFGTGASVPEPFRGRQLTTACLVPGEEGAPEEAGLDEGEVLATADGRPVWVRTWMDGRPRDTCRVAVDAMAGVSAPFERLNGRRFMDLLPVLEWMRRVSGFHDWTRPPLRAALMFDDPNLHALRYGYVDYPRIAAEGRRHRYHTTFATVPFDAWYVNARAARCFRDHAEVLSLLVHGNNHTHRELAGGRDPLQRLAWMRQALRRIERLDRRAGLTTARVMAPPHGACSEAMMNALREAGFEAACISAASVRSANPNASWTGSLGLDPAAVIAGLPVIPRFRLEPNREGSVWLAAYLDQPIIPVGHHWDLAEGTGLLCRTADLINGLGEVVWGDVASLSRLNYRSRVVGSGLWLQPFSRRLEVSVPEGVDHLILKAPWRQTPPPSGQWAVSSLSGAGHGDLTTAEGSHTGPDLLLPVRPGHRVCVRWREREAPPDTVTLAGAPPAVVARRLLVEMRDRVMPGLPKRWQRR